MSYLKDLIELLERFNRDYRKSELHDLELSGLYDLFPERGHACSEVTSAWNQIWPNSESKGVYVFLGEDLELAYIGKASK